MIRGGRPQGAVRAVGAAHYTERSSLSCSHAARQSFHFSSLLCLFKRLRPGPSAKLCLHLSRAPESFSFLMKWLADLIHHRFKWSDRILRQLKTSLGPRCVQKKQISPQCWLLWNFWTRSVNINDIDYDKTLAPSEKETATFHVGFHIQEKSKLQAKHKRCMTVWTVRRERFFFMFTVWHRLSENLLRVTITSNQFRWGRKHYNN